MDDLKRRKYRVDPLPVSAITFRAPKELVDRTDVFVCVEYSTPKKSCDDGRYVMCCQVWCRFKDADVAQMVYKDYIPIGDFAPNAAFTDLILNGVLQSPKAVQAIQKYAGTKKVESFRKILCAQGS